MYIFTYNKENGDNGEDYNSWEVLDWDDVLEARWLYLTTNDTFGLKEGWAHWVMPCRFGKKPSLLANGKDIDFNNIKYKHEDTWKNKPNEWYDYVEEYMNNHTTREEYYNSKKSTTTNNTIRLSDLVVDESEDSFIDEDVEDWDIEDEEIDNIEEPKKVSEVEDYTPVNPILNSDKFSLSSRYRRKESIIPKPIGWGSTRKFKTPEAFIHAVHSLTKVVDSNVMADFLKDFISNPKQTGHITVYVSELDTFYEDFIAVLNNMGFEYVKGVLYASKLRNKEYTYFISARKTGKAEVIYSLKAKVNSKTVIEFIDLNKILNIPKKKLILDYGENIQTYSFACGHAIYSLNHYVTQATCVEKMNKPPMTITGYGKKILKSYGNHNLFVNLYKTKVPEGLDIYRYIDNSYHGGFQYFDKEKYDILNKQKSYSGLHTIVLDVNSLYDYAMKYEPLPLGEGHYHRGKPNEWLVRDFKKGEKAGFFRIKVDCCVKKDKVPTLSKPRYNFSDDPRTMLNYDMTENYITNTTGMIEVILAYPDYLLLKECYDIRSIEFIDYIWFMAARGEYFGKYIDKFYKEKESSNGAVKKTAKMLLVTPYGYTCKKKTYFNIEGDEVVESENKTSYLHIGSYISAWSRYKIVMDGLKFKKYWLYSDTDSLHLILDKQFFQDLFNSYEVFNKEYKAIIEDEDDILSSKMFYHVWSLRDEEGKEISYINFIRNRLFLRDFKERYSELQKRPLWIFSDKGKTRVLLEKLTKKNNRDNGIKLGVNLGEYKIEKLGYFNYYKHKVYVMNDESGFHITKAGAERHSMDELENLMNTIKTDIEDGNLCGTIGWVKDFKKDAKEYYDKDKVEDFVNNLYEAIEKKDLKKLKTLKNIPIRIKHKTEPFKYSYGYYYGSFIKLLTDEYKYL